MLASGRHRADDPTADGAAARTVRVRSGTGARAPALHTAHPLIAQVWRDGPRQVRLAALLKVITVHPFEDGRTVGRLLAQSTTPDFVDAHLVLCAVRIGHDILTGGPDDIAPLLALFGPTAPTVHTWPETANDPRRKPRFSCGQIEDERQRLTDLAQDHRSHVASDTADTAHRHRADVLALCGRSGLEPVGAIRIDEDLGTERPQGRREWHDLDHGRVAIEDPLRRDGDRGVRETGLAAYRKAKIELDNITRAQHRARPIRRHGAG